MWLVLWPLMWASTCGDHLSPRPRWNQSATGASGQLRGDRRTQIVTTEAATAAAPPDPAESPAAMAHPSTKNRRDGPADRGSLLPARKDADPVRDDQVVADLVTRARNGDQQAWDALVERYSPLIWHICRRHRLGDADAEDVGQSVWLHLVDQLGKSAIPLRFLAGWPPRPGGSASGSCAQRGDRWRPGTCRTPTSSPMSRPGRPSRRSWWPSATPHCARHSAPAPLLPAADRPADRRPVRALCRDQRQAGHPGRQHRA